MSQKKNWDPEQNTHANGDTARDLGSVKCCVPVSMSWAEREGRGLAVGYRHTGYLCAGEFVEMPFKRWQRCTFRSEKRGRK